MNQREALKLALEALEEISSQYMSLTKKGCMALAAIEEALAEQPAQQYNATSDHRLMENAQGDLECINLVQTGVGIGKPEHEPVAYSYTSRITGAQGFSHHPMPRFIDAESWDIKPLYTAKHPIIPAGWKLVPVEPTPEMLKAMDECSTEGYDERLLAGHAWSVYTAAIDATPEAIAPPRKPWVGLTDDEMRGLEKHFNAERVRTSDEEYLIIYPGGYWAWQRAIEAKLKEKNT